MRSSNFAFSCASTIRCSNGNSHRGICSRAYGGKPIPAPKKIPLLAPISPRLHGSSSKEMTRSGRGSIVSIIYFRGCRMRTSRMSRSRCPTGSSILSTSGEFCHRSCMFHPNTDKPGKYGSRPDSTAATREADALTNPHPYSRPPSSGASVSVVARAGGLAA